MNPLYPWQLGPWRELQQMKAQQRLPHALLLNGPAGLGKSRFARHFARSLLCRAPTEEGVACGACPGCLLTGAGSHPDFRLVTLEKDEKTNKEAKLIKVDQIRELLDFVNLKSHFAGVRVAIIDPADLMNRNAANSLLKTLEEPPPYTLLMLVADQVAQLPATIRSRCQALRFTAAGNAGTRAWLAAELADVADPETLLAVARNRPLAAVAMVQNGEYADRQPVLATLGELRRGQAEPITVAARWTRMGIERVYRILGLLLPDLARLKIVGEDAEIANRDLRRNLNELAKGLDLQRIFEAKDQLSEGGRLLAAGYNVREQDLIEDFTLYWTSDR